MKIPVCLCGVICLLSLESTNAQQWQIQTAPTVNDLWGVHFISANAGVAVGSNGSIVYTTNGGTTWLAGTNPGIGRLNDVRMLDASLGFAVGFLGTINRTTNGGATWTQQTSGSNVLDDVHFFDPNNGIATTGGDLFRTTNGGQTWSTQNVTTTRGLGKMAFANTNTGVILAGGDRDNSFYFRTTNGGQTWSEHTISAPNGFLGIAFGSSTVGTTVGPGGKIFRTTDGGVTWFSQTSGTTNTLHAVSMADANNGTAVGTFDLVLRTTNGGAIWSTEPNPLSGSGNLYNVQMVSADEGWAVGVGGSVIHRVPGPVNVSEKMMVPLAFGLEQNYPNPFNPMTNVEFGLPTAAHVSLRVYDVLGREVATLVDEVKAPGRHSVRFDATGLSSGVYFYRIDAGSFSQSRKLLVMK